jgi:CubicO group peptidase (beta-lactamase class C family)
MDSTDNLAEQEIRGLAVPYTSGTAIRPLSGPGPGRRGQPHPMDKKSAAEPAQGPLATSALRATTEFLPYRGTSAGGGYSTASDLNKFGQALVDGRLLNAQFTSLVSSGQIDTPRPGLRYAYGFEDEKMPDGVRRFGHSGGAPGMNATLSIFPSAGYVVVVLANRDPPSAQEIARFISERLPIDGRDNASTSTVR